MAWILSMYIFHVNDITLIQINFIDNIFESIVVINHASKTKL